MGVSRSVFFKMKKKYKDVAEAIKKGKEVVDIEVENALLKRAIGYDYEEVKTYIQENSGKVTKRKEVTVKHIAGDVTNMTERRKAHETHVQRHRTFLSKT